jgi:REP element-mobilizing transposase RayT
VLDYIVTSNHIHLLVKDTGSNVIAQSMQLIAGRTAQEYNQRKGRQGAFCNAIRKPDTECLVAECFTLSASISRVSREVKAFL